MVSQAYMFPFFKKDSEEAKKLSEWVDSNITKATKQDKVIETKIGDLYFTMYGQPYMRFLEITSTKIVDSSMKEKMTELSDLIKENKLKEVKSLLEKL